MDSRRPGSTVARRARSELQQARDLRYTSLAAIAAGAFLGWAAVFAKAFVLEATGTESGYILLVATVIVAAWVGGIAAGVTATAVSFVLNSLIFIAPSGSVFANDGQEAVRLILFLIVALGTTLLVATRRAARDRLATALDEAADLAAAVEERDERLEMMLAASGTGFWEWDIPSGRLDWSDAIFRQHGLDPAAGPPDFQSYLSTIHPDDRERFTGAIEDALAGRSELSVEFRIVRPDGAVVWTHGMARVYRAEDGEPVRMLGTGQDITERRRLSAERDALIAEERQSLEFREAFVDVISHELRTPITTILGLTQILARGGHDDRREERMAILDDIRSESERLHRLVEDLLVLSRVERGGLEVEQEPIHLGRLLQRVVTHEIGELPTIGIRLAIEPELPIVLGETTYVEQIVRNLLENAAKYAPRDTEVLVDARARDGEVAVVVEDHGPGVPRASRARLFELFYRDPSSARSVAGSGIGLFVCASLVEAMGGRIWVEDTPGGGARFGFTLRPAEEEGDGLLLERSGRGGELPDSEAPSSEVVLAGADVSPATVVEPGA
jgi:PAS domain S-box-containing protein